MTREEIEQLSELEPYCFETDKEEQWYRVGLKEGLKAADANPKSPWISVEKDLPCNHPELITYKSSIYSDITIPVLAVLAWNGEPSKKHIEICCMCDMMGSDNVDWYWCVDSHYQVVCWMPLPEMPN